MGGLWPWALALLSLPGLILGVTLASSGQGACVPSFLEDVPTEETEKSEDKDIPAINQGLIPEESPENSFLIEGDILRPSPFQLLSASSNKWPKNGGVVEVPFVLSKKYNKACCQIILEAIAEFERLTCIRFVSYQGQRDFVSIVPMSGCFSSVGRSGGMQVVSLSPTCLRKGKGIVLHELMHVLGFWHEQSRADRDRYVRINWNEIRPGFEINFMKSRSSNMMEPYDYSSIMHYGRFAFSRRGQPTIVPLWDPSIHIGQRWNLSASDITRVLRLYDCDTGQTGVPAPGHDKIPTSGSASLPWILKVLAAPRPDPSGPMVGGQPVASVSGESPGGQEPPALRSAAPGSGERPLQPRRLLRAPRRPAPRVPTSVLRPRRDAQLGQRRQRDNLGNFSGADGGDTGRGEGKACRRAVAGHGRPPVGKRPSGRQLCTGRGSGAPL
ncbi:astacin-like metalloendopeptidase [Sorex araneus]|uniref:astacin-like metalloendopeptidase n=1 Tax=Sorex araneus TaxID=42254 RepID=UPI0024336286|nr:astacin-like metalloendopeptidase [Sorex araneus]